MSTIINFRQIMKVTLTLISFLRPVFFFHRQKYFIRYGRWQSKEISLVFCIPDSLLSLTKFPPIITQFSFFMPVFWDFFILNAFNCEFLVFCFKCRKHNYSCCEFWSWMFLNNRKKITSCFDGLNQSHSILSCIFSVFEWSQTGTCMVFQ